MLQGIVRKAAENVNAVIEKSPRSRSIGALRVFMHTVRLFSNLQSECSGETQICYDAQWQLFFILSYEKLLEEKVGLSVMLLRSLSILAFPTRHVKIAHNSNDQLLCLRLGMLEKA